MVKKQIPNWLFGILVAIFTVGTVWVMGKAIPSPEPSVVEKAAEKQQNAPLFTGRTTDGKTFDLAQWKGKVVLINFWATWCGPCRMEIPDLITLQEKYGPQGFTVVGVSQDDSMEIVLPFIKENKINYPVIMATREISQQYEVRSLPSSLLVNREGKVVWAMAGVSQAQSTESIIAPEIEKALK
jgi:thiol-disulfide isomerase/thioredoxin